MGNVYTYPNKLDDNLSSKIESGKSFVISTGDLAGTAGTEVPRILIRNPLGSGKKLKIYKVEEQTNVSTGNAMYRYYKDSIITLNGTPFTISNSIINNTSSAMQAFLNPTASNNGTRLTTTIAGQMETLIREDEWLWILPENSFILINVRTNAAATTWCLNVYWIEE